LSTNASNNSQDPGHIRHIDSADGYVAVFSIATHPYYLLLPVAKWALIKRDGADHLEAMVPVPGVIDLQPVSNIQDAILMDYAYLPLYVSAPFTDARGVNALDRVKHAAVQLGQRMEAHQIALQEQEIIQEPAPDESP
jgi:hypothetical protein